MAEVRIPDECLLCKKRTKNLKGLNNCTHRFCYNCFEKDTKTTDELVCVVCQKSGRSTEDASSPRRCGVHPDQVRNVYCEKFNVVICAKCAGVSLHRTAGHDHVDVETRFKQEKEFLQILQQRNANKQQELESLQQQLAELKRKVEANAQQVITELDRTVDKLKREIDNKRNQLVTEITSEKQKSLENVKEQQEWINQKRDVFEKVKRETDQLIKSNDESVVCKATAHFKSFQQDHSFEMKFDVDVFSVGLKLGIIIDKKELKLGSVVSRSQRETLVPIVHAAPADVSRWKPTAHTVTTDQRKPLRSAVNPNASHIALTSLGGNTIRIFDIQGHKAIQTVTMLGAKEEELFNNITDIAYLTNDNLAVLEDGSNRSSNTVRVFSDASPYSFSQGTFTTLGPDEDPDTEIMLQCLAVHHTRSLILIGDSIRKLILIYNYAKSKDSIIQRVRIYIEPLYLDVSNSGLIAVSSEKQLSVASLTGKELLTISRHEPGKSTGGLLGLNIFGLSHTSIPRGVCFDLASRFLFIAQQDSVDKYSLQNGRHMGPVELGRDLHNVGQILAFGGDKYAVTASEGVVIFQEARDKKHDEYFLKDNSNLDD